MERKERGFLKINKQIKNAKFKWVIKKYGYDGLSNDRFEVSDQSVQNTGAASLKFVSQKAAAVLTMSQLKSFSKGNICPRHVFSVEMKDHRQIDDNFHL